MTSNLNILVVDDIDIIRDSMRNTLYTLGIKNVHCVENGADANDIYKAHNIDIVFMDINLDGHSGLDVMEELKIINPDIYTVILSGESNINNVRKAISLGAKGFVVKPYSEEKIKEMINTYIDTVKT